VETEKLAGKSGNTPFSGWRMKGAATCTILGGAVAFSR
jgi:dihydroorotase-like cyclic amidohydrolase